MALPADFSKIFASTATGGITPPSDLNYAKGWEWIGANPPEKNDFNYLQNLSDLKAQWLYNYLTTSSNAASRTIGTGINQIPDMSSFTTGYSEAGSAWVSTKSGWSKGPNGTLEQWGVFGFAVGTTGTNVVFPVPFPVRVESIILTLADIQESQLSPSTMPAYGVNSVGVSRTGFTGRMSGPGGFNLAYIARGR